MARVLIADDDRLLLTMLREFVESLGHEVKTETDGLQAGIRVKEWLPDLVISDIKMPNFYGTSVALSLQQDVATERIPVIFVSGVSPVAAEKALESIRKQSKHPDRLLFVPKPIDFKALEAHIVDLIAKGKPRR